MVASSSNTSVSFVIATLNSGNVLTECLISIRRQTCTNIDIEIIIVDGGSTDNTLTIAQDFNCKIIHNPLKTAEAAKTLGIKSAKSDYIVLADSDNILPIHNWLQKMLLPLIVDNTIIGSEPWKYTYRSNGGFIERYSALTGVNDPYCLIAGNYDRQSLLTGKWTGLHIKITNFPDYQTVRLTPGQIFPTIGANGTIYRSRILKKYLTGDYFFDTDFINRLPNEFVFAKVKVGIIHTYCESSVTKFYRKQLRRVKDLYQFASIRKFSPSQRNLQSSLKFTLYVITIAPLLYDTVRGYAKKPDPAWLFHPLACLITLYLYSTQTILYYLGLHQPLTRNQWHQ